MTDSGAVAPVYLDEHPPAISQFHRTRKAPVSAIVVHTAENRTDLVLPDDGAEGVASYIARRSTHGSYASIVDSDSTVRVGEYGWTMFHCAGFNSRSLGLSFACRADQWATLPSEWTDGALGQGAAEAARMCRWVQQSYGYVIPAVRLSKAEAEAGKLGFVSHAAMDPSRRSDPGYLFPWDEFLRRYVAECVALGLSVDGVDRGVPTMDAKAEQAKVVQRALVAAGYDIGSSGPGRDGVDGDPGLRTLSAVADFIGKVNARVGELTGQVQDLQGENAVLRARADEVGGLTDEQARQLELAQSIMSAIRGIVAEVERRDV